MRRSIYGGIFCRAKTPQCRETSTTAGISGALGSQFRHCRQGKTWCFAVLARPSIEGESLEAADYVETAFGVQPATDHCAALVEVGLVLHD